MLSLKDFKEVKIEGLNNVTGGETGKFTTLDNKPNGDFDGDDGGWYVDYNGDGKFNKGNRP